MRIYHLLSNVNFLKSYSLKLLFIAVLGIHIPLIGLAIFLSSKLAADIDTKDVFLLTFGLTVLASAASLFFLNEMVQPVKVAKNALWAYLTEKKLPSLPMQYKDEVGVLMQSVQKSIESLDDLLKEKQDMMALLSHDLRSPISSSISLAELIKMESNDPVLHGYCDKIVEQSEKQLQLLHTVLNMLRQDHFYIEEIEKFKQPLLPLLDNAERSLEMELKQKNIQLLKEVPPALQVQVQTDVFMQVLINLLHNAIKFSFRDSDIRVSAAKKQGAVEIQILDKGMGFETEKASREAFDRFTSQKRSGTEGEPTTGLGLYLCRKIVQRHGGNVYARSEGKNKGTTFFIVLPV